MEDNTQYYYWSPFSSYALGWRHGVKGCETPCGCRAEPCKKRVKGLSPLSGQGLKALAGLGGARNLKKCILKSMNFQKNFVPFAKGIVRSPKATSDRSPEGFGLNGKFAGWAGLGPHSSPANLYRQSPVPRLGGEFARMIDKTGTRRGRSVRGRGGLKIDLTNVGLMTQRGFKNVH